MSNARQRVHLSLDVVVNAPVEAVFAAFTPVG